VFGLSIAWNNSNTLTILFEIINNTTSKHLPPVHGRDNPDPHSFQRIWTWHLMSRRATANSKGKKAASWQPQAGQPVVFQSNKDRAIRDWETSRQEYRNDRCHTSAVVNCYSNTCGQPILCRNVFKSVTWWTTLNGPLRMDEFDLALYMNRSSPCPYSPPPPKIIAFLYSSRSAASFLRLRVACFCSFPPGGLSSLCTFVFKTNPLQFN